MKELNKTTAAILSSVLPKKSARYALTAIKSEGCFLIATDGQKLVTAENDNYADIPDGLYKLDKCTLYLADTEDNFPKWQDIMPTDNKELKIKDGGIVKDAFLVGLIYSLNCKFAIFDHQKALKAFGKLDNIKASQPTGDPQCRPFTLTGTKDRTEHTMVVMPVTIK